MALPDLTGQNIENTYQRVLQTDGVNVYDGTGSLFVLPSANTSSLLVTASATSNQITFTKGDASQFTITVDTGSASTITGANQQVLFISGSEATGSNNLLFDYASNTLTIDGELVVTSRIDTANFVLKNSSDVKTVDWQSKFLYNSSTTLVLDWERLRQFDNSFVISVHWDNRNLHDANATIVLDWNSCQQFDPSRFLSIDWAARGLYNSATTLVLDWEKQRQFDPSGLLSTDWAVRGLHDTNESQSLNWSTRELSGPSGNTTLDWTTDNVARVTGSLVLTGSLDVTGSAFIRNLSDTPQTNVVTIDSTTGQLFLTASSALGGGGGADALDDLSDVAITSPVDGEALIYNAGIWQNGNPVSASYALTASYALNGGGGGGGVTVLKKENITFASSSWVSASLYEYTYTDIDIAASSSIVDFTPNTASIATVIGAVVYPTVVVTAGSASFYAANQPADDITGELVITNI